MTWRRRPNAGTVAVTARELELRDGGQISSNTFGPINGGTVEVHADRLLVTSINAARDVSLITGTVRRGSTGQGGTIMVSAHELELSDGGQIFSGTFGLGNGGTVEVRADHLLIKGSHGDFPSLISGSAQPGSGGAAGTVAVTARELELRDGGEIFSGTFGPGDAGPISVEVDHLLITGTGTECCHISSSSQVNATGRGGPVTVNARDVELRDGGQISSNAYGVGDAGPVTVKTDQLLITGSQRGIASSISSSGRRNSSGAGGTVNIQARNIQVRDQGVVETVGDGTGPGGHLSVTATETLRLDHASIRARTETANAGDLKLAVGRLFDLHDSTVTTSVAGGRGSGGNITIDPPLIVLDNSRIQANAQQGAGGKITIRAGQLIRTPDSVIQASSAQSVSGTITITAPNTDVSSSLTVLSETLFDASNQLREACAARGGRHANSFKAGGRGGLPPDPGAPLAANPFGQPLKQQTSTGLPTALMPRPPQAVKPMTMFETPQPVLGSPPGNVPLDVADLSWALLP
jgi:large exoprotein involved in heme utilization and adhesion